MYEKIMVPLDGSELAECVLPHVEAFIKGCHVANVVFVRVVPQESTSLHGGDFVDPEILEKSEAAGLGKISKVTINLSGRFNNPASPERRNLFGVAD